MSKAANSIKFKIEQTMLINFVTVLKELVKIDSMIYFNFTTKNEVLIYSLAGTKQVIYSIKSYLYKISELFSVANKPIDKELKLIVKDGQKFIKNLSSFIDYPDNYNLEFFINEDDIIENVVIKNSKLKMNFIGTEPSICNNIINLDDVIAMLDISTSLLTLKLFKQDFDKIKKLSLIDKVEDKSYRLEVVDNKIYIKESGWSLMVGEGDYPEQAFNIPAKYFNNINFVAEDVVIYFFDNFLLVQNNTTNFVIALEVTI